MKDTTSTPDDSDGRVVTDRTAANGSPSPRPVVDGSVDESTFGTEPSTTLPAGPGSDGGPDDLTAPVGTMSNGTEAAAPQVPDGSTATVLRSTPHLAARKDGTPSARPSLTAVPHDDEPSSDAPTATLRVSAPSKGTARYSAGLDEVARSDGRSTDTDAGPGGTATNPPPWNRMPGQRPVDGVEQVSSRGRPAGGLLDDDDEPTAFLAAAVPAGSDPDPEVRGRSRAGGWAAVRAVRGRPPRQAALQLKRLDPWSVLKLALVLAVVLFLIWLVAVGVIYGVLDGIGVWDRLNGTYADLVSGEAQSGSPLISAARVFTLAAVVGAINSLLFAVAVTVGAFVYNVSADLVGGIEVTLSERD